MAALSNRPKEVFDYFQQLFAQVTNPPLDAIREELITAVSGTLGPRPNILSLSEENCRQIYLPHPVITEAELAHLKSENKNSNLLKPAVLDSTFPVNAGTTGLQKSLIELQKQAEEAILQGAGILIVSDQNTNELRAPIPSLLSTGAIHHLSLIHI